MNTNILNTEVQKFINSNLKSDITKLVLKGSPFTSISIQELVEQIVSKSKCEKKLQTWFSTENIYYPNKLNIEQTSSEITANYKANLVSGDSIIDVTGGYGIDSCYFSKKVKNVTHCELNEKLSQLVAHNLKQLNIENIETFVGDGINYIVKSKKKYDWIYADPSRRNDLKGKVFLLNDCTPNIPKHLDELFKNTENILLKVSPILDIKSAISELKFVKEIHVISIENEVKELLFILEKKYNSEIFIKTSNLLKSKNQYFNFKLNEQVSTSFSKPKKYLFEPNSAILKAGAFKQISSQLKIDKLHQHSHLYTSDVIMNFPGRHFIIENTISYDKKLLKKLIPSKKANITIRNFPETVVQIRKKTGLKDGGNNYLFFTTDIDDKHIVLICKKV
ncbi:class I SAM-dependent methyltransferase [Lutibacter citreus]|uniref:class I SAM-dependent methyltransferase n=1 Tax=Lutibacter citreus TaxID=2138210 RepID=UPI000DBEA300|nr:class I SAM-dependent methyltransferase [Lutibacter citreus]